MKLRNFFGAISASGTRKRRLAAATTMTVIAAAFSLGAAPAASAAAPPGGYANGFENASDVAVRPTSNSSDVMFNVTRKTAGTDGSPAAAGAYYAQAVPALGDGSQFTRYGGYSSTFPTDGYTTSVDIHLDTADSQLGEDTRFDWSSAINDSTGAHRRDFIFNVGTDGLGGFVMSASNNTPGWPANPGRSPITVSTTGWYTFQHTFRDNGGVLAVDMSVLDDQGAVLGTWTLSDPSDTIATTGGNRYGSIFNNQFSSLAIDNITRSGVPTLGACLVSITGTNPITYTLLADCITDQTIHVPNAVSDGTTFDGDGHSITAIDPVGGHFLGAVVQADAGVDGVTVKNLTVTASSLSGSVCDGGADRLRGILFDVVPGTITNNTVTGIKQGTNNGCQEGNAIEVRNHPDEAGTFPRLAVTITGNTVSDYQKGGIIANGILAVTIKNNSATGAGPVNYIAQNGIQVAYGATAQVKLNSSSGNSYTPKTFVACGFLIYKAAGVSASGNNFFNNERNQCNFGKGGGTFKPSTP